MIPDLVETALGIRNKIQKDKQYLFLVYDNLVEEELKTRKHSSKLWPETMVVDLDKMNKTKFDPKKCSSEIFEMYVTHLLFRYTIGIGDLADRNFVVSKNILYSVDEESISEEGINVMKELRKNKADLVKKYMKKNSTKVMDNIKKWIEILSKLENTEGYINKLEKINLDDF